jgi:hypothetical protein
MCNRKETQPVYNVPIFLVVMTVVLVGLIYWGGFQEEARNR